MASQLTDGADLTCLRCGAPGTGCAGCDRCASEGLYVNLVPPLSDLRGRDLASYRGGPWAWRDTLPLLPETEPVTLGEGDTPCFRIGGTDALADVWIKNEGANPSWSHKDRAMSVAVAKAVESGAEVVVAPSSGNAGLAAAAYAARAGLRAVIVTYGPLPPVFQALLEHNGALLIAAPDFETRSRITTVGIEELGWYPLTFTDARVGGNPYGNAAYKSIAYELARDIGDDLGAVVIPTSRADLMSGVARGFEELVAAGLMSRFPAIVAAEEAGGAAFSAALAHADPAEQDRMTIERKSSAAFSIGSDSAHWQGLWALRISHGWAVPVEEPDYLRVQAEVGRTIGLAVEAAAAVAIAASPQVAERVDGAVVALSTSIALKDPAVIAVERGAPVCLEADARILADHVAGRVAAEPVTVP